MATQQPTYQAHTVVKREGQDDFWLNIGAAFMHQDGDGFNIVLQALPINGKIVLRLPKADRRTMKPSPPKRRSALCQAHPVPKTVPSALPASLSKRAYFLPQSRTSSLHNIFRGK